MREHINNEGRFQSDKYPTCPPGKVPLSTRDLTAQDLLWEYAQRRRAVDPEFADDLEICLKADGCAPVADSRLVRLSKDATTTIEIALQEHLTASRSLLRLVGAEIELGEIIRRSEAALVEVANIVVAAQS